MLNYQKMYSTLFNAITDAIIQLDAQNVGVAKDLLKQAQIDTEELYVSAIDEE